MMGINRKSAFVLFSSLCLSNTYVRQVAYPQHSTICANSYLQAPFFDAGIPSETLSLTVIRGQQILLWGKDKLWGWV